MLEDFQINYLGYYSRIQGVSHWSCVILKSKCIVLDLLQYRPNAVLIFQGGLKEVIFILSISYSGIVGQGGCCCHSDLYSKKLGCFWWCCLSRFSNPAMLHHGLGENALWCLLDEGPHTLWKHWEKESSSRAGRSGMGHWRCKSAVRRDLHFYRCTSWVLCLHAALLLVKLPWSWGVLWLISGLFNLCRLICVTAQHITDIIKTTASWIWGCRKGVLQWGLIHLFWPNVCLEWLFHVLLVQFSKDQTKWSFRWLLVTILYHFNGVTVSLLVINRLLTEKSEPSWF